MKTIIVDDTYESRYLLEVLLRGNGHDVEAFENGANALERIKKGNVDLVVSDVLMPVMDGFQLCRNVKGDDDLRHIPFIIYTATYTGPKDEALAQKMGADRFIVKPCEPDLFMKSVQEVMANAGKTENDSKPEPLREEDLLKLYNERLVRKLEKKMLELEKEVRVRRDVEAELRRTNSFLDLIIENIPDMIFLKDVKDSRIIRCNRAAEDFTGYSRGEMLGKRESELFPEKQVKPMIQENAKILEREENIEVEEVFRSPGRQDRIFFTKNVPVMDSRGEKLYVLGISKDITDFRKNEEERIRLNAQLVQAQKLESLGNLAGGIAHDFNNILSVIIGFTEIALFDAKKNPQVEGGLKEIYRAVMRAKELVRQILTFARRSSEEVKPVMVSEVVMEVLEFTRSSIPSSIEIIQEIESDSYILGNSTQLHQVVMNLCTNAAQAMGDKGGILKVTLTDMAIEDMKLIRGQPLKPGDYVNLIVSDTGTGISPGVMGSIFEPYFTTKSPGEGTGLGLALVHGIVESYGGRVDVWSEPGSGTVFSVYIPVSRNIKSKQGSMERH